MSENQEGSSTVVPEESGQTTQPTQTSDPASGDAGQSQTVQTNTEAPSKLPENLQGKSAEDIARMYSELESKLGEQSNSVAEAKKIKSDTDILLAALSKNPELYSQVDRAVRQYQGQPIPDSRVQTETKKGDGEANKEVKVDDVRLAQQDSIIRDFQGKYGLDKLAGEKLNETSRNISTELMELLDPGGNKTLSQILNETRLDLLPKFLENAYWLSQKTALADQGGLIPDVASIASLSGSNSRKEPGDGLSTDEVEVAKKLGITSEQYAAQKKKSG